MSTENAQTPEAARENLEFALRAIRRSVDSYITEGGAYFILWSLLIPVGTLLSYVAGSHGIGPVAVIWSVIGIGGGVGSRILTRRRNPDGPGTTGGMVYTALWRGLAGALAILGVAALVQLAPALTQTSPLSLNAAMFVVGLLLGIAFSVTGAFSTAPWMKALGLAWWLAALIALFVPPIWAPAVIGGATLPLNGVPGLILERRFRRGS
jgi:hypothetical protein